MKAKRFEKNPASLPLLAVGTGVAMVLLCAASFSERANSAEDQTVAPGRALYEEHCGVCHQYDGSGVPFFQPELIQSPWANAGKGSVIQMILWGSKAIPDEVSEYENQMPSFEQLTNEQIALIATYVRTNFENNGGAVSPDDVARERGTD